MKKHRYTVSMDETFGLLEKRLLDANLNIDQTGLKEILDNVDGKVITIGCGGSLVVANYLSKILEVEKVFSICRNARDIMHSYCNFDDLFAFSYSGKTPGIMLALNNFKGNKALITCNHSIENIKDTKVVSLGYETMNKEKSFVSLASTLIPIGEFLKYHENISKEAFQKKLSYYLESARYWVNDLPNQDFFSYGSSEVYEIMTGYDTEVASYFLESTLIESGLGNVIVHDKYGYCHGRSTINYHDKYSHNLIYLINEKTELDDFLLKQLENVYFPITVIDVSNSKTTSLERQYELLIKAVFLCRMDLSQVDYDRNIISKVYKYKGEM